METRGVSMIWASILTALCVGLTSCTLLPAQAPSPSSNPPDVIQTESAPGSPPPETETADPTPPETTENAEPAVFKASAWGITFSFEYPSAWRITAPSHSSDDHIISGTSFSVLDEAGKEMATLNLPLSYSPECSYRPCESLPVVSMDDQEFSRLLIGGESTVVQSQAMDLTSRPDLVKLLGWKNNVRLVIGLGGNSGPHPAEGDPSALSGVTRVKSAPNGGPSTSQIILFNAAKDFATLSAAKEYVATNEYLQIRRMISSFNAESCSGRVGEPKSYTGSANMSGSDQCGEIYQDGGKGTVAP